MIGKSDDPVKISLESSDKVYLFDFLFTTCHNGSITIYLLKSKNFYHSIRIHKNHSFSTKMNDGGVLFKDYIISKYLDEVNEYKQKYEKTYPSYCTIHCVHLHGTRRDTPRGTLLLVERHGGNRTAADGERRQYCRLRSCSHIKTCHHQGGGDATEP